MANTQSKTWLKILIAVLVVCALAFVIWRLAQPKTTVTSDIEDSTIVTSMTCTAGDVENPVYRAQDAQNINYSINLLFKDGVLSQLSLQYTAQYDSEAAAETQLPYLLADYNLELQDRNLSSEYFDGKSVGRIGDKLQISFTADEETINTQVADYLMMDADANGELPQTEDEVRANYVNRSFVCSDVVMAE